MEACPIDHKLLVRTAWEDHGETQAELRAITNEGADILAEALTPEALQDEAYLVRRTASHQISPKIPFDETILQLPPDVFGPIEKTKAYAMTQNVVSRALMGYRYKATLKEKMTASETAGDYNYVTSLADQRQVPGALRQISRTNPDVDQEKWAQYQEAAELQKLQGMYFLEYVQFFRKQSTEILYDGKHGADFLAVANGRFDYFKTAVRRVGEKYNTPADFVTLPVSEYGQDFTEKLIRTTLLTCEIAQEVLPSWSERVAKEHPDTIRHIARIRNAGEENKHRGAMGNTQEGVNSIAQTLALLTAQKVPGYESGEELVEAIVDQGLVEQFTRNIPMNFIGPITNEGRFIPELLQSTEDGLRLNPEIVETMKELKRDQLITIMQEWAAYQAIENPDPNTVPAAFGLICPAAMPHGAISRLLKPMSHMMSRSDLHDKDVPVDTNASYAR